MTSPTDKPASTLDELKLGQVPSNDQDLKALTVGKDVWIDFYEDKYLQGYTLLGGSKVKFLIGKSGTGKTHALRFISSRASELGYLTVWLDARKIKLQRIDTIYREIATSVNLPAIVQKYCEVMARAIAGEGFSFEGASGSLSTALGQHLGSTHVASHQAKQKLAGLLRNPDLHRYFGIAVMHLAQDVLGLKPLREQDRQNLYSWLLGAPVPANYLKLFQIFTKLDRYNSRHMLRSLFAFVRLAGYKGTLVCIDFVETLVADNPENGRPMYSRIARDDAYEMIRQLIDEADNLESAAFLLAARPELFSDSVRGVKSYYALWMRIQDEIVLRRFNKFADNINFDGVFDPPSPNSPEDRLLRLIFGEEGLVDDVSPTADEKIALAYLCELSRRVSALNKSSPLDESSLLMVLRQKGPVSPVKRIILETLK